ncbi:unnamed protein product [Pleuronectes platessa]|uniref:Uncharacterized protein n=1 Tax=Pleuronectes platessa TaxID=8262 RepID=A0A9N7TWM8_PLEPL|nr:unnamed protein product [Pleuronectes platessa]
MEESMSKTDTPVDPKEGAEEEGREGAGTGGGPGEEEAEEEGRGRRRQRRWTVEISFPPTPSVKTDVRTNHCHV